jgi:class 3 adenylate cyclase
MGFEGRRDYAAVGSAVNLGSRLCDEAADGQILIGQRAYAEVEDIIDAERVPDFDLKGFSAPVPAWSVLGLKS